MHLLVLVLFALVNALPNVRIVKRQEIVTPTQTIAETPTTTMAVETPSLPFNFASSIFYFVNGNTSDQIVAENVCELVNTTILYQCGIFSPNRSSNLIGTTYFITADVFSELPSDEKTLWYSTSFSVSNGLELCTTCGTSAEDKNVARQLITLYGKSILTWPTTNSSFPIGAPQVVMAFTDNTVNPQLVANRDSEYGVNRWSLFAERADIIPPAVETGADAYKSGTTVVFVKSTVGVEPPTPTPDCIATSTVFTTAYTIDEPSPTQYTIVERTVAVETTPVEPTSSYTTVGSTIMIETTTPSIIMETFTSYTTAESTVAVETTTPVMYSPTNTPVMTFEATPTVTTDTSLFTTDYTTSVTTESLTPVSTTEPTSTEAPSSTSQSVETSPTYIVTTTSIEAIFTSSTVQETTAVEWTTTAISSTDSGVTTTSVASSIKRSFTIAPLETTSYTEVPSVTFEITTSSPSSSPSYVISTVEPTATSITTSEYTIEVTTPSPSPTPETTFMIQTEIVTTTTQVGTTQVATTQAPTSILTPTPAVTTAATFTEAVRTTAAPTETPEGTETPVPHMTTIPPVEETPEFKLF